MMPVGYMPTGAPSSWHGISQSQGMSPRQQNFGRPAAMPGNDFGLPPGQRGCMPDSQQQRYGEGLPQYSNNFPPLSGVGPSGITAVSGPASPAPSQGPVVINANVRINVPQRGPEGDFGLP